MFQIGKYWINPQHIVYCIDHPDLPQPTVHVLLRHVGGDRQTCLTLKAQDRSHDAGPHRGAAAAPAADGRQRPGRLSLPHAGRAPCPDHGPRGRLVPNVGTWEQPVFRV